jgi:outer membrane protein TolC
MAFCYGKEGTTNKMKRTVILIHNILCLAVSLAHSQLTVETCWKKAAQHYPLSAKLPLIRNIEHLDNTNANLRYLPQVNVSGKGTAQTEVMQIPFNIPGIEEISKYQYTGVIEVNQMIWDGGVTRSQKRISAASSQVDKRRLAVELYALNERINKLFFGILLTEEQLKQNTIFQVELQTNYSRYLSLIQNGLANQVDLDLIKVEQLNADRRRIELSSALRTYREMLSEIIGEPLTDSVTLVKPDYNSLITDGQNIQRPEIAFFDAQNDLLLNQKSALLSGVRPKVSLFGQGLLGRPGVNLFENDFSNWLVAGVKLGWDLGGLYSLRNSYAKIENKIGLLQKEKETFLFNTRLQVMQQKNETDKFRELIKTDEKIIALRNSVKKASEARVENGTISVTDLIKDINAVNLAIQEKSLHEIQLLISIYNLKNSINN